MLDDRTVVETKIWILHDLRDQSLGAPFLGNRQRKVDIDIDIVLKAKEVRENRINAEALKLR